MEIIQNNLIEILATIITAVASFIGVSIKKATVEYIEQIYKTAMITNEDKLAKCKEKALEWLNSKGLKISDTELEILIESAVNGLKKTNKEEK